MTTTTEPRTLTDLTRDLADFLDLPETLDLPRVANVQIIRSEKDPTWSVCAQLPGRCYPDDAADWEMLRAWSCVGADGVVEIGPVRHHGKPYRKIWTVVSFVGIRVEVWTHVGADFVSPDELAAALLLETAGTGADGAPC